MIDQSEVVEKILRHMGLWCGPATFAPARPSPEIKNLTPAPQFPLGTNDEFEPMPDYENVITD